MSSDHPLVSHRLWCNAMTLSKGKEHTVRHTSATPSSAASISFQRHLLGRRFLLNEPPTRLLRPGFLFYDHHIPPSSSISFQRPHTHLCRRFLFNGPKFHSFIVDFLSSTPITPSLKPKSKHFNWQGEGTDFLSLLLTGCS